MFNDPCYAPGQKVGSNYFVGIIGLPNPCEKIESPTLAIGEPLDCMCRPRGPQSGDLLDSWEMKKCKVYELTGTEPAANQVSSVSYFARTYPKIPTSNEFANKCLFKVGLPIVQQLYISKGLNLNGAPVQITWPAEQFFEGTPSYNANAGVFAFDSTRSNIITEIFGYPSQSAFVARYLSSWYYFANRLHFSWALFIAPEDASISTGSGTLDYTFKWSNMVESRVGPGSQNLVPNYFLEPISTSSIDGLLTTRIHDKSSTEWPQLWFRDYDGDGIDIYAYKRFVTQNVNQWGQNIESEIISNIDSFKYYYKQLWETLNPEGTVTRKVSTLNEQNYLGNNDWYIPSMIEMNYIAGNLEKINAGLITNGGKPLLPAKYWTSTSVCRVLDWDENNHQSEDEYVLQDLDLQQTYNSRRRYYSAQMNLSEEEAYDLSQQICNGVGMSVQDLSTGHQSTVRRDSKVARFRPVRRIPLVYGSHDINIEDIYEGYSFSQCRSCLGYFGD